VTGGHTGAAGWGVAISTDTALARGALTLAAGRHGRRLRVFLLTLLVVDDVVALLVVSVVYPGHANVAALLAAAALLGVLLSLRAIAARQVRTRGDSDSALWALTVLTTIGLWLALFGLQPWTSRVVVPLFALANAGVVVDRDVLAQALTSPVTWGIVLAYVAGKPLGILAVVWAGSRGADRRSALPLRWDELRGVALSACVGFTMALLIASRAFHGALLGQAKVGILATALVAPALSVTPLASLRRGGRRTRRLPDCAAARPLTAPVPAR
jgi:Na+/H+ antiporter NhaA